jgi:ankyrin repeat protein
MNDANTGKESMKRAIAVGAAGLALIGLSQAGTKYTGNDLFDAVKKGNSRLVKAIVGQGVDVNVKEEEYGLTPLALAAMLGNREMCGLLLTLKADVNARNGVALNSLSYTGAGLSYVESGTGYTPLHWAAVKGFAGVLRLLLDNGADMDAADTDNKYTPLQWASIAGQKETADMLLAERLKRHKDASGDFVALNGAVLNNHSGLVKLLLGKLKYDRKPRLYGDALEWAAVNCQDEILGVLLTGGGDVNKKDEYGASLLHGAIRRECKDAARLLLARGADPDTRDIRGDTPLQAAKKLGDPALVTLLVQKGAKK